MLTLTKQNVPYFCLFFFIYFCCEKSVLVANVALFSISCSTIFYKYSIMFSRTVTVTYLTNAQRKLGKR